MAIEERLAALEQKVEALEAAIAARQNVELSVHVDGRIIDERIRRIAAEGFGAAQHRYNSQRG